MSTTSSNTYQRFLSETEAIPDSQASDRSGGEAISGWGVEVTFLSKGYVDSAALDTHYAK
jgi:hypothetical protein